MEPLRPDGITERLRAEQLPWCRGREHGPTVAPTPQAVAVARAMLVRMLVLSGGPGHACLPVCSRSACQHPCQRAVHAASTLTPLVL